MRKVIVTFENGVESDVTQKFPRMNDRMFARIIEATKNAGRVAPVAYRFEAAEDEENYELDAGDRAVEEYEEHKARMQKAMSY